MIDEILGEVKVCPGCSDEWPDDPEFFAPGDRLCRACRWERNEERRRKAAAHRRAYRRRYAAERRFGSET